MTGPVHFIYLGGPWCWQYGRALRTADVHGVTVILWSNLIMQSHRDVVIDVEIRPLEVPDWLREHPVGLAGVKDLYAYQLLYDHGGMVLDLDTISLRPAWDLLPDGKDLLVSGEYPDDDPHPNPCNNAAMIARKGASVLTALYDDALRLLAEGEMTWGATGPHLVSRYQRSDGRIERAPYRALNGWSYHQIGDYYENPRDPGDFVRVIHLYSSDHQGEFLADRWMPNG